MAGRLKHLKGKPLLNPPGERQWWLMTGDDADDMAAQLGRARSCPNPQYLVNAHYWMRKLGLQHEIPSGDVDRMTAYLDDLRGRKADTFSSSHFTVALHRVRELGIEYGIGDEEMMWMMRGVDSIRQTVNIMDKIPALVPYIDVLYCGEKLGLLKFTRHMFLGPLSKLLEMSRAGGDGYAIALSHYQLREFGEETKVTLQDARRMRAALREARMRERTKLAPMLYLTSTLMESDTEAAQLPPVKRFGK